VGRSLWSIHIEQEVEGEKEEVRAVNEPTATNLKILVHNLNGQTGKKEIQLVD
jgi:hypothetical protein